MYMQAYLVIFLPNGLPTLTFTTGADGDLYGGEKPKAILLFSAKCLKAL